MNKTPVNIEHEIYQIKIKGFLGDKWSDWFDGFEITHQAQNVTILIGPVSDQGALHGMLAKFRDLGLHLISVESFPQENNSK